MGFVIWGAGQRLRLRWTCCDLSRRSRLLNRRPRNDRPKPAAAEDKPLNISGNMIILNIRGGDTFYHSKPTSISTNRLPRRSKNGFGDSTRSPSRAAPPCQRTVRAAGTGA